MLSRLGNSYDRMVMNGVIYDLLIRNGVIYRSQPAPPVGRTIPITLSSGDNIINGDSLPYEGGTTSVQNGDTVVINGANLTGYLSIENFNLPNGQHALIKNNGLINAGTNMIWIGDGDSQETTQPLRNVTIDFYNQDGINEYGLKANMSGGGFPSRIVLNSWDGPVTWENVIIRGIEVDCNWQPMSAIRWAGEGILYNNGTGVVSTKNLTLDRIKLNILSPLYGALINFSSSTDGNGTDNNYHENLAISNVEFNGDGASSTTQLIHVSNTKNYTIRDVTFNNLYKGTEHTRLIVLYGYGNIFNIRGINHYGNILQLIPFKRSSDLSAADVKFHNILGYNNKKYALVEVSGIGNQGVWDATWCTPVSVQGDFCTAHTLGNGDTSWKAGIIDVFGTLGGETVIVNNSVVQNANVNTTSVGATGDNNYVHPTDETISPNLDTITFEPTSNSPIIGIGGTTPLYAVLDINGVERPLSQANLGAIQTIRPTPTRVIPITLIENDDTIINGNSLPFESGTTQLQDGDIIELSGATDYLEFNNFNLSSGKAIVRNNGIIEISNGLHIVGITKNIDFDFYQNDTYGLLVYWNNEAVGAPARIWFDPTNQGNWENVSFRGLDCQLYDEGIGSPIFQFGTNTPLSYNNGAGTLCSDGLTVSHVRLWMDPEEPTFIFQDIIKFPGLLDNDTGHHKNLTIDNIVMDAFNEDIETLVLARNMDNLTISNFTLKDYNMYKVPGTFHSRLMKLGGTGRIFNIKSTHYYGNLAQIIPLRRIGTTDDWKIWNIIGYDCPMYSLFEAQIFESNLNTGFFESAGVTVAHATAKQLGYSEQFPSSIIDQFQYTGAEVYNSVVDTCYEPGIGLGADNYIYPDDDPVNPLIDPVTFVPGTGSPIIGAATSTPSWALVDINGNPRPATGATLGAVESQ